MRTIARSGIRCLFLVTATLLTVPILGSSALASPGPEGSPVPPLERRISLDLQDASLRNLFRLLADQTDLNVILDESVSGKVTLKLDRVTWEQVLDTLLLMYGLEAEKNGDILLVLPAGHKAFQPRPSHEASEPMVLRMIPLNFAPVDDVARLLHVVLSKEGQVDTDPRTNMLIIRDHPKNIEAAIRLIGHE